MMTMEVTMMMVSCEPGDVAGHHQEHIMNAMWVVGLVHARQLCLPACALCANGLLRQHGGLNNARWHTRF